MKTSTSERMHRRRHIGWMQLDLTYDLFLLSHTHQQIQVNINSVAAVSASVDLNVHNGKRMIFKYNTMRTD
ncbi:unnamed protein product [Schistosoma margrebowiei]|uniref:Uncharacterized protein n=1 Tax=Schistosoma margrebowiei TaxID=48269 RepID=A0A183M6L4_9TREM|nr:unnamed protein product [Schistosoma margrebowiei]